MTLNKAEKHNSTMVGSEKIFLCPYSQPSENAWITSTEMLLVLQYLHQFLEQNMKHIVKNSYAIAHH